MKRVRADLFYLLLVCFSLLLTACFSPWAGEEDSEIGTIVLDLGNGRFAAMSQIQYTIYLRRVVNDIQGDRIQHGQPVSHASSIRITVSPGIYHIELEARLNVHDYATGSTAYPVTVMAGGNVNAIVQMTMSFNLDTFLADSTIGNTADNPILLPWASQLSAANWNALLSSLENSGKFVSLDLSAATRGGSSDILDSDGVFDPRLGNSSPGMTQIVGLTLPEAAEIIADGTSTNSVFQDFSNLRNVNTGNGIVRVGTWAFNMASLETLILGNKVEEIRLAAFYGNNQLTTVNIPNSVNIVGADAFGSSYRISEIILPDDVEVQATAFFYAFSYLASEPFRITIGTNVTFIGTVTPHGNFQDVYAANGAGVYIYDGTTWVKQ